MKFIFIERSKTYFYNHKVYNIKYILIIMTKKGYKVTEEHRQNLSISHKGHIPWNKGKKLSIRNCNNISEGHKGQIPWNKNKKYTKEEKIKIFGNRKRKIHESYQKWLDDGKPKMYCQCSNHEEIVIKESHKNNGVPKYILGHNSMGEKNPMYGKKDENHPMYKTPRSEETKRKIGDKNRGRCPSNETKIKQSERRKGRFTGNKHPNWKGGISFEPYCSKFNNILKEEIRERDNRICQNCGKNKEQNNNRKLSVHHIHYDKPNCDPDLITLCCSCNSKVNFNRNYWEEYFMKILKEKNLINWRTKVK